MEKMLNNIYCVYRHRRLDNNQIFYIGIGNHERPYVKYDRNKYWNNIVNKVGYTVEVLVNELDWETACELEILLISEYGRKNNKTGILCNMTDGGDGILGYKHTKESIEKIRQATINKISTEEYKLKMYNVHKGRKCSEETKLKMSISATGKIVTQETRNKLKNYNLGKKHTDETKLKVALNNPRRKELINIKTGVIYFSITEAAKKEKISLSSLIHYLKGSRKNITNLRYNDNIKKH
jgi:hypothetical protein